MRHDTASIPEPKALDSNGLGYLVSSVSVLFLGAASAYKPHAPWWYYPVLIVGMVMSISGMAFRYMAHLRQKRKIARAQRSSAGRSA